MGARAWASVVSQNALGPHIDTRGATKEVAPTIIEVYPGATARALRESGERYKKNASARRPLLEHAQKMFNVDFNGKLDTLISSGEDSNSTDAFLAALTAAIYLADCRGESLAGWHIRRPDRSEIADAAVEGWIFFPIRK